MNRHPARRAAQRCSGALLIALAGSVCLAQGQRDEDKLHDWNMQLFAGPVFDSLEQNGTNTSQWTGLIGIDTGVWHAVRPADKGALYSRCRNPSFQYGTDLFAYYLWKDARTETRQGFVTPRFYGEIPLKNKWSNISFGGEISGSRLSEGDGSRFDSGRIEVAGSWRFLSEKDDELYERWRLVPTYSREAYTDLDQSPSAVDPDRSGTVSSRGLQVRWFRNVTLQQYEGSLYRRPRTSTSVFLGVANRADRTHGSGQDSRGWAGRLDIRLAGTVLDKARRVTRVTSRVDLSGGLARDTLQSPAPSGGSSEIPTSFGRVAVTIPFGKDAMSLRIGLEHRHAASGDGQSLATWTVSWDPSHPWRTYVLECTPQTGEDDGASTSSPANTGPTRPVITPTVSPQN